MSVKKTAKRERLRKEEIDDIVVSRAEDDAAWEPPIQVHREKSESFSIAADLARRAAFLARVHHSSDVEEWLARVIRERIELEEGAYAAVKREMHSSRNGRNGRKAGGGLAKDDR
jgi:hypothetical protein